MLLVRDGKRTTAAQRVERELLKNDAFDRLRDAARSRGLPADDGAADHHDQRRRRTRRSRPVRRRPSRCSRRATSSSTRRRPCRSTRRSTRRSRSTCSGRRASPRCSASSAATPHLVAVSTCYVAGNRRGNAPEELVSAGPFDLGLSWRDEVAAARRLRSDSEAASRQPDRLAAVPRRSPPRARRRRRSGARRQDRAAARALGARSARRGRARPGGERRLARRLRLHQGARRAGAHRLPRRRAGEHRAAVDHRVGVGRAAARAGSAASGWPSR